MYQHQGLRPCRAKGMMSYAMLRLAPPSLLHPAILLRRILMLTQRKTTLVPRSKSDYSSNYSHSFSQNIRNIQYHFTRREHGNTDNRGSTVFLRFFFVPASSSDGGGFAVWWVMAVRGVASYKPSSNNGKGRSPLTLAQRVFLVLVIKLRAKPLDLSSAPFLCINNRCTKVQFFIKYYSCLVPQYCRRGL